MKLISMTQKALYIEEKRDGISLKNLKIIFLISAARHSVTRIQTLFNLYENFFIKENLIFLQ